MVTFVAINVVVTIVFVDVITVVHPSGVYIIALLSSVAIKTTGNVYSNEAVKELCIKSKTWKDSDDDFDDNDDAGSHQA